MKYSSEFIYAMHDLIVVGKAACEIQPPNGSSSDWERDVFNTLSAIPDKKRRTQVMNQYTVNLPDRATLNDLIFNPPARTSAMIDRLEKDEEKTFTAENYIDYLTRMGFSFRLCDLDDSVEVNEQVLSDVIEAGIRVRCRDVGINRLEYMRDAFITEAAKNHYNPILDYLNSLTWNGQDHITTLAVHLVDEHDLTKILLKRWLIGAVARNYEETQNRMLVLDGKQGIGKSRFVSWLASPLMRHFHEGEVKTDDKDYKILLSNTWIWEVSELGSTIKRSDIEALKAFLTMIRVKVRAPYQRNPIDKPAITSFIGTVNNIGGVLNDASGNRRFMATTLVYIDFEYTKIDVNQVWAQAVALYKSGECWNIEGEERELIDRANEKYETENPVIDKLRGKYEIDPLRTDWFTPTLELIEILHDAGWGSHSPVGEAMIIASACKKIGLQKGYLGDTNNKRRMGYFGLNRISPES